MSQSGRVLLFALGAACACSSDSSTTTTTPPAPAHTVTATVTGSAWTTTQVRATYLAGSGFVLITAIDSLHSPASEITLYVGTAPVAGVYTPLTTPSMVVDFTRGDSTWNTMLGKIGSVTFTSLSTSRVAGSFDVRVHHDPALTADDSTIALTVKGKFDVAIP